MTKLKKPPQILTRDDLFRMCEECDRDRRALREEVTFYRNAILLSAETLKCHTELLEHILKRPEL